MGLTCARRDCTRDAAPDPDGLTRYYTVLCSGAEVHRGGSGYVHRACGEELLPELVARVDYLPYCRDIAIAHRAGGGVVSEVRASGYYYCGHPVCLVSLLGLYGRPEVKEILQLARVDLEQALAKAIVFNGPPRRQLDRAIRDVAAKARLEKGGVATTAPAPVHPVARPRPAPEARVGPVPEVQHLLQWGEGRKAGGRSVLIVGAGAAGCFLATKLLGAGHQVVLMDRLERVAAIRSAGLHVHEGHAVHSAQPVALATSLAEAFPPRVNYDLLLLATKAYDVAPTLRQLPGARFSLPPKVMTLQDGVGAEETAEKLLGAERVLAASLTVPLSTSTAGSVRVERAGGGLGLAPVDRGEDITEWARLFSVTGALVHVFRDYRSMKWSKLLLTILGNVTCAILDRPPAAVYRYRPTLRLEFEMLKEAIAVVKKMEIPFVDLPGAQAARLARSLARVPAVFGERRVAGQITRERGDLPSSLRLDVAAGRAQSEVAYLNGAVVRQGIRMGVPTPVNYALTDTLDKLCKGVLLWDDFRGKPEALLALCGWRA